MVYRKGYVVCFSQDFMRYECKNSSFSDISEDRLGFPVQVSVEVNVLGSHACIKREKTQLSTPRALRSLVIFSSSLAFELSRASSTILLPAFAKMSDGGSVPA